MAQRLFPAALIGSLIGSLALIACESAPKPPVTIVKTVTVEVPVPVRVAPPAELTAPFVPETLPTFVSPADPAATSALTAAGETKLRLLIFDLTARIEAWRAWAAR